MKGLKKIVPSQRTQHIEYAIRDIVLLANKRKKAGGDLFYLNIGDPVLYDFKTPIHLIEASSKAMFENHTSYAQSEGIPEAIDAIHKDCLKDKINPFDIMITTGASEAIDFALSALVNRGDNVLLPSPGYPLYSALLARLLGESRYYKLDEDNNWMPDIDHLVSQIDDKTKAIAVINPNNPTGAVYSEKTLRDIIEVARQHNLVILSDEIYSKLIMNGQPHIPMATIDNEVPMVTFNGLSKSYLCPGFRIGWGITTGEPELISDFVEGMKKLARARLCACHPKQYAISVALNGNHDHLIEALDKLKKRRDLTVERLNSIKGISCQKPNGAFYAFPKVHLDVDDEEFVKQLIKETGVVVVHGSGFGPYPKSPHFRIVFLPSEDILNEAYNRIEAFMKRHTG